MTLYLKISPSVHSNSSGRCRIRTPESLAIRRIGAARGWIARDKARERVRDTLSFYADQAKDEHGWFYHFINVVTGERNGTSEVSVSDATWLFAGALTAKQYFSEDKEIARLTQKIYDRVDYDWIRNGDPYLMSHGYRPETGLLA